MTGYRLEEGKEYAVGVPADWKDGINRRTDFGYEYSFYDVPSRTNFTGLDPDERDNKIIPKEIIAEYFSSIILQPSSEEWEK